MLAQYFPEFDRYYEAASEGISIVKWCLDPAIISDLSYEEFVKLIAPQNRTVTQQKRIKAVWEESKNSIGCKAGEVLDFEAKIMVEELQKNKESLKRIESEIKIICLTFPEYSLLLSIPGFGPDISSKVLAAIGDPLRFKTGKQVLKMAGLDLCASRSGKSSASAVPVISKRGKASLRYALYQAALIATTRNQYFMASYTKKIQGRDREKGIKTKMRVKFGAKMLIIAWTLMKKGEPFDPECLIQNM